MTTTPRRLTVEQREFLATVSNAVFANPFSEERVALDLRIAGLTPDAPAGVRLQAVLREIKAFVARMDSDRPLSIRDLAVADRELVEKALLFDIFHAFAERMDALIRRQLKQREPCAVPFARDMLELMTSRGIVRSEALRYLALFFQLRRAYYFIDVALIGRCASMTALRRALWNNVFTCDLGLYEKRLWNRMEDFATLLLGETGTGKGAAAGAIGRSGFIPFNEPLGRFAESFMDSFLAINLSQFPESLIESELFGHRKGAFTGAVEAHEGIFARCSPCGAIFLDELGDVSIPVQIKLLNVIQERTFTPVGSHEPRRFSGRVIAATHRDVDALRSAGTFRNDFYYRLCSDTIRVPSLRQRLAEEPAELDELMAVIVERIAGVAAPELIARVAEAIRRGVGPEYAWPGNVRELEQAVRRVLLTNAFTGESRPEPTCRRDRLLAAIDAGEIDAAELAAEYCRLLYERHGTYEAVARRTQLDRRTVKKYIERA